MNFLHLHENSVNFDVSFDMLSSLESIIKMTQKVCLDKEISSVYYNLPYNQKITLSEERNHYINMLSLALDKITSLKEYNFNLEKKFANLEQNSYNGSR